MAEEEGAALVFFLLILGFVFIVAEVFFPSLGILGIAAAVSLVSSIFLSFQEGEGFGFPRAECRCAWRAHGAVLRLQETAGHDRSVVA